MINSNLLRLGLVVLLAVITSTVMGANGCMWVGNHNGDALASGSSGIIYKVVTPFPLDGAKDVPLNTILSWTRTFSATGYDVYFSTNNPPDFQTTITSTNGAIITPTRNAYYDFRLRYNPGTLNYDTTYYWRIDPKNDTEITTGNVWTFTTIKLLPPPPAILPVPSNNAQYVRVNTELSWASALNVTSYDVYFGTNNPPDFKANVLKTLFRTRYNPGPLNYGTTYYWQVDAKNDAGTVTGTVWTFTTLIQLPPPPAILPLPPNNAKDVRINSQLGWASAFNTDYYDVYFGTTITPDFKTSITNTNIVPLSASNINPFRIKYDPGTLSYGTTYYWRIDTRNIAGTTTGTLWTFVTISVANGAPPKVKTEAATNVSSISATVNGKVNPNGLDTTVYFQINALNAATNDGWRPGTFTGGTITPPQSIGNGTADVDVSYDLITVTPNTYYSYRCFATNSLGTTYGFYVTFSTFAKPNAPSALSATAISYRQVNLAWTDNSDNELGFVIERSLDGISFTYLGPLRGRPEPLGATVPPSPQVPVPQSGITTFTDFTVTGTTTYYYRVFAVNQAGASDYSNVVPVTTPAAPSDLIPPTVPRNLTAVANSAGQVVLNWTASTDNVGVTGYNIYRVSGNGWGWNPPPPPTNGGTGTGPAPYATVDGSTTTFTDTNITAPNIYVYTVVAFDATGNNSLPSKPAYVIRRR